MVSSLVHDLYGTTYKANIEEIFASDSKNFYYEYMPYWVEASKISLKRHGKSKSPSRIDILFTIIRNYPKTKTLDSANHKILIIYEADKLERIIQQALRRTMEKYSRICRFILVANSVSNIIDPIRSRCVNLKLFPLSQKQFLSKIKYICESEEINITENALKLIYYYSNNDMNIAINILEAASCYKKKITENFIYEMIKKLEIKEIGECLKLAISGNIVDARNFLRNLFIKKSLSGKMILKAFNKFLMESTITEELKKKISTEISKFDSYISVPSNNELQLSFFLTYLATLGIKN
ncbi:MAG: hypothetical protein ACTSQO_06230 [Candidatus Helarchaeota archaeon]